MKCFFRGRPVLFLERSIFPSFRPIFGDTDDQDGVMVSFLGGEEGTYEGILELASNDPAQPSIQLALQAQVTEEEEAIGGKELMERWWEDVGVRAKRVRLFLGFLFFPALALFRRKQ